MNLYNVLSNRYVGMSNFERLFAQKFGGTGGEIKELEGAPPLTFRADGTALIAYRIYGNTVQSGTPTPENPIMPIGCGELETTGVHAGQYKLPILSNGVEYPIYLGEVETTRRIKKLVLTGEERWTQSTDKNFKSNLPKESIAWKGIFCSHFSKDQITYNSKVLILRYNNTNFETSEEVKSYLAAQYAAGTPVTIWYVLAEPETGIMNEPLMKIGDYADTLNMEQAGVSIPTNKGSTTLDVDTTIKPSNVYIKYHT